MNNFESLKQIILQNKSFILTTHVNPDADAICSEMAIYLILKKLGKDVKIINYSATPYNLEFLDKESVIEKYDDSIHKKYFNDFDVLLMLDLNQFNRIVKMEESARNFKGINICIDHHQNPEKGFGQVFGSSDYSATGEIIYDFIKQTNIVELDYEIAYQLYTAIMTDTGSFRFERTTPKVHIMTAEFLELGINPVEIYDKVYDQFHFGRIKLLGAALSSIELDESKKIACMTLTQETIQKNGAVEADVDGFVNHCLSIQNVLIGILIYELKDGIKISFRSKGSIPVNKLAEQFGGGGHVNASGTRLYNVAINEIKDKVLQSALTYLNN